MEKFVIHGGKPLVGEVEISGAKNAAVAILPATILAGGKCVIENLPNISDVSASVDILSAMGAHVRVINKHTLEIDTAHITATSVPNELSRQMRASYYFLARCWAVSAKPPWPCPAAVISARAPSTSTSRRL